MEASVSLPRVMLAAPQSGCGKTTLMCAVLKILQDEQLRPAACKCGPDYIDPMFHREVLRVPSRNIDLFLFGRGGKGERLARYVLAQCAATSQMAVIEGAMGYYDGIGATVEASPYEVARATATPVIVVVNGKGAGISLAAQIRGLASFRRDSAVAGFIVNHVSAAVYERFKKTWEAEAGVPALGYFPYLGDCALPSRHLGLVKADEITSLQGIIRKLADAGKKSLDMEKIVAISRTAPPLVYEELPLCLEGDVSIAVAKDEAFCFYYDDSLALLERLGAKIVCFSPVHDSALPPCDGLYLGGGYPELYGRELAANEPMRNALRRELQKGLPCIAECGGFMYLSQGCTINGTHVPWVGFLPGEISMTDRLTRFGYVTLTAQTDTMLCRAGESICAHEFHYSDSTHNGNAFVAAKASGTKSWPCGYAAGHVVAAYPHIHFLGNIAWARRFVGACRQYRKDRGR